MTMVKEFLEAIDLWPIIMSATRYYGDIEGYGWFCIPQCEGLPQEEYPGITSEDEEECQEFWANPINLEKIGLGDTPNDALMDMVFKNVVIVGEDEELNEYEIYENQKLVEQKAQSDCIALITSCLDAQETNNYETIGSLMADIVEEWEQTEYGLIPLLENVIAVASTFIAANAYISDMDANDVVNNMALNMLGIEDE